MLPYLFTASGKLIRRLFNSSVRRSTSIPTFWSGSLLFLQHMISKMKPAKEGGSRIAIVFNGSPLFTGDAGSGESEIRRWIIENDLLEAIIGLPDQLFYNTGIFTYVWIVTNRKRVDRRGKVLLINAADLYRRMRKSLNNKRNEIGEEHVTGITRLYGESREGERCRILDNADFGFRQITIERPLRLNLQCSSERIVRVTDSTAFQNLAKSKKKGKAAEAEVEAGCKFQEDLLGTLRKMDAGKLYRNRGAFDTDLTAAFETADIKLTAALRKAILASLSERDETADICTDADGHPEPDPELRDYENVPLKQDIRDYFDREVKPHVPDAWINEDARDEKDGQTGRVG